ncbi:hypothetical protein GW17_00047559 [Ensete ventricosum]|nr:hypothetical protein GW17_00047559 [Ensete ventricosum]
MPGLYRLPRRPLSWPQPRFCRLRESNSVSLSAVGIHSRKVSLLLRSKNNSCSSVDLKVRIFHRSEELARSAIFYSYTKHINGFAAMLEEEEATLISGWSSQHPDVISVFENTMKALHTTRSWDVMGGFLNKQGKAHPESIWARADYGDDIIVANFDTGSSSIPPSMPSFLPSFSVWIIFDGAAFPFERCVA